MLSVRIIPCLDVHEGRVVKGVNFVNLIDAGDPVEQAKAYEQQGADELVFLDITASSDERNTMIDVVKRTADQCFMPLTVGGAVEWAKKVVSLGAGEILLTSMDSDGTKNGFDNKLNRAVSEAVAVPVIASGGAGTLDHLADAIDDGKTSAVLAASIFHFGTFTIREAKQHLQGRGLPVRL